MSELITKEYFESLTPMQKGYAVYMVGNRDDQPNVPATYEPATKDLEDYIHGQQIAIVHVQDSP